MDIETRLEQIINEEFGSGKEIVATVIKQDNNTLCACGYCGGKTMRAEVIHYRVEDIGHNCEYYLHIDTTNGNYELINRD